MKNFENFSDKLFVLSKQDSYALKAGGPDESCGSKCITIDGSTTTVEYDNCC